MPLPPAVPLRKGIRLVSCELPAIMAFADIVGHDKAIEVLRRAAGSGRVAQAYLFAGPPNIGKTTVAKQFAKALNCEKLPEGTPPEQLEPCGICHNCVRIEEENHPDFMVLRPGLRLETRDELPEDAASEQEDEAVEEPVAQDGPGLFGDEEPAPAQTGPSLFGDEPAAAVQAGPRKPPPKAKRRQSKIAMYVELPDALIYTEQIQEVVDRTSVKLAAGTRHRVIVITEADRIQYNAVDRLLKTLEEPPARTTFVLTSSNPAVVKDTIVSRCQTIKFQPLTTSQMLERLTERCPDADADTLRAVAAMAGGRFGRAEHLLATPAARAVRDGLLTMAAESTDALLMQCMAMGEKIIDLNEQWLAATDRALAGDGAGDPSDRLAQLRAKAIAEMGKSSPDRFKRIAMNQLLDMLQSWYRDLALLRAAPHSQLVANSDWRDTLGDLAPLYTHKGLRFASQTIENTRADLLGHNANMRLACEVLMCKLIASRRRR